MLSVGEVRSIHQALAHYFEESGDAISPPGEREPGLLESAVERQRTGWGGQLKWKSPFENAASLMYGLCMNHPFHNGNKRCALVACLNHLDKNKWAPCDVTHGEFYELVRALAAHDLQRVASKKELRQTGLNLSSRRWEPDEDIAFIASWIKLRSRAIDKREYPLTFRQLRQRLQPLGVRFSDTHKNFIDLTREIVSPDRSFLARIGLRKTKQTLRINLSCAGDGEQVGVATIKDIRRELHLRDQDGVDSGVIYGTEKPIESILNEYRTLLKRLARV